MIQTRQSIAVRTFRRDPEHRLYIERERLPIEVLLHQKLIGGSPQHPQILFRALRMLLSHVEQQTTQRMVLDHHGIVLLDWRVLGLGPQSDQFLVGLVKDDLCFQHRRPSLWQYGNDLIDLTRQDDGHNPLGQQDIPVIL